MSSTVINMLSVKQKYTMELIDKLIDEFGEDRWFVQTELPRVTAHSMDALVRKKFLETKEGQIYGMPYYRRVKVVED